MKLRKVDALRILRRKEDSPSTKVYVLYLNPEKFSDTTAKFINYFKHQLMIIIVNTVEEILKLINGQVADDLDETFIPQLTSGPFLQKLLHRKNRALSFAFKCEISKVYKYIGLCDKVQSLTR